MKTDRTTKFLLGIIATALIWIGIQLTPMVSAGPEIIKVDIVSVDGRSISSPYAQAIPVKIVDK